MELRDVLTHTLMICSHRELIPTGNKNLLHTVCTREFSGLLCFRMSSTLNHKLAWRESRRSSALEGPTQHPLKPKRGPHPPLPPVPFGLRQLGRTGHVHHREMAEKKRSAQAREWFPHQFLHISILSRRLIVEWKPRV